MWTRLASLTDSFFLDFTEAASIPILPLSVGLTPSKCTKLYSVRDPPFSRLPVAKMPSRCVFRQEIVTVQMLTPRQEGEESVINLEALDSIGGADNIGRDDPEAVKIMVEYMYNREYKVNYAISSMYAVA